ncbi:hypothetical protein DM01DRAFT_1286346 [Hesseltinella vesiculosa]|uniref:YMC020W-like alpha/beta hydrolase domain-containing protein n=1 Tax=Hesseltinella vesiculosa TaxID=101127 RepID=A0A1X2GJT9_9FUNG|nr:hypothetical protein DM01DRAFT_1286346 [Hesseltinella vesiculosa]
MTAAVKHYFEIEHNLIISDDCITCVPLEGEGKVEDRVNLLYTNLINNSEWLEAVSSADVILWATHSQGTPVSVRLLHRLLERGHIHTHRQSVGLLAMAGIAHGPFPYLKGSLIVKYFEADAARELFEFMDSESDISQKFRASLVAILDRGTRVTLVASMQDQVVPLYSAIISAIQHPNILRSIYIDSHIYYVDDFLINLITFALQLRNAGLSDHGLLTHISDVLAGNLYAFEGGHSTIYEERHVYGMAVQHLFETLPLGRCVLIDPPVQPVNPKIHPFQAKAVKNPYCLPWAMRGICEDPGIISHPTWSKQLEHLHSLFEAWQPTNPKLHSVKLRLEPWSLAMI